MHYLVQNESACAQICAQNIIIYTPMCIHYDMYAPICSLIIFSYQIYLCAKPSYHLHIHGSRS